MTDVTRAARDLVPGRAGRAAWRVAAAGLACALAAAGCGAAMDTAPDASVTSSPAPATASAPDFVDSEEPAYVEIRPGDELQDALQAAFDACGDDSSKDAPGGA